MSARSTARSPQEKVCGYEYTVRRGDSFYLIANRLGVPLRDLLEANSDINPARLMVGDVLCIPMEEDDAPPATPVPPTPVPLPVEPAVPETPEPETPSPTPTVPQAPNTEEDLDAPAVLPQTPQAGAQPAPAPSCPGGSAHTVTSGETAADIQLRADVNLHTLQAANPNADLSAIKAGQVLCVPAQNTPCPVPMTYTLLPDETLESAALKLNASLSALLRANPCMAPSDFRAGACIFLPED